MKSLTSWLRKWLHRDNRIVPSVYQVLLWCVAGILLFMSGEWLAHIPGLIEVPVVIIVLYSGFDLILLRRLGVPKVSVQSEDVVQIGLEFQIFSCIEFQMPKRWNQRVLKQFSKAMLQLQINHGMPWYVKPRATERASISFPTSETCKVVFQSRYVPGERGPIEPERMDVAWFSPFRMWCRFQRHEAISPFVVYPDITTWRKEILNFRSQLTLEGRHIRRLVSGDQEFDYIAEYTPDDEPRRINWAATARRGRTMKNVYMPENGQHVVVAIDASRYMAVRLSNGKTRFDLAVESALALIQVAISAGDYVSLVVFSNRVETANIHGKGMPFFHRALHTLANIQPRLVQGGYESLFRFLETRIHKRSFVVILSEFEGVRTDVAFLPAFSEFHRRYPILFITMADIEAIAVADETPTKRSFAKWTAAHWRIEQRQTIVAHLRQSNVAMVESLPGTMAVDVVRAYVEKRNRYIL